MFLLPLSILYYKLGDLRQSAKYLKKLKGVNPDTLKFLNTLMYGDAEDLLEEMEDFGYRPSTIEQFAIELQQNAFLFSQTASYITWGLKNSNQ